ncbi:MAG: DEAD/DEAH box helicase [Acholeplasmataceae bacterium]
MIFKELNIITPILEALFHEGYEVPTPIQEQAIPVLLEGRDILGSAQTGTGKTAAFAIPIIQGLYQDQTKDKHVKALILAPTRELAEQIKDSFRAYSYRLGLKTEVIYGGVSQRPQVAALFKGVDILIATPGRLIDLMHQGYVHLDHVKYLVLDEADRMLDMGFIHDVKTIVATIPKARQTMLFSATVPHEIHALANSLLNQPVRISVTPPETTLEAITQHLYFVNKKDKTNLMIDLFTNPSYKSILAFTRTKHGANKLVKELLAIGVKADAIHGNKSQNKRQEALTNFKNKKIRVLVATDIAARGIDIDELSHVINYDLPESAETYIHRIGRTGRAGLFGAAISFCSHEELHLLKAIEKHINKPIDVVSNHLYHNAYVMLKPMTSAKEASYKGTSNHKKHKPSKKGYQTQKDQSKKHDTMQYGQSKDKQKRSATYKGKHTKNAFAAARWQ